MKSNTLRRAKLLTNLYLTDTDGEEVKVANYGDTVHIMEHYTNEEGGFYTCFLDKPHHRYNCGVFVVQAIAIQHWED
jgi:hypothetical protein